MHEGIWASDVHGLDAGDDLEGSREEGGGLAVTEVEGPLCDDGVEF